MVKKFLLKIWVFELIILANTTLGQWTFSVGNYRAHIFSVFASGTNVIVSANNDVFLSTDNGTTWSIKNESDGIFPTAARAYANIGTTIIATASPGVCLSKDGGKTWSIANNGLTDKFITAYAVTGNSIYASTGSGNIFLSADTGKSWTQTSAELSGNYISALATLGANLFAATYNSGVYLSADNGIHWSSAKAGLPDSSVYALEVMGNNLFAGTYGGVYLSTDNGLTWSVKNNGLTNLTIRAFTKNGNALFAGTNSGGVFRSLNNSASWSAANTGMSNAEVLSLSTSGSTVYAVTDYGTFYSNDSGTTWAAVTLVQPLYCPAIGLKEIGTGLFAHFSTFGILRTFDTGQTWMPANSGIPKNTIVYKFSSCGTNIFVGTYNGAFLLTNNGANWNAVPGLPADRPTNIFHLTGSNLIASVYQAAFFSSDNGVSWTPFQISARPAPMITECAMIGTNIFAGTGSFGVFLSPDNGKSWSTVNNGLTNLEINDLKASGTALFAGTNSGFFISTDNGTSWSKRVSGLTTQTLYDLFTSGTSIFAATDSGIFLTSDNGANWSSVNDNLPQDAGAYSFAASGPFLFVGTNYGIWRRPLTEMISSVQYKNKSRIIIAGIDMNIENSNFFRYTIPSTIELSIKLFDLSGRCVQTLFNCVKQPGSYSDPLPRGLSQGSYVLSFQAGKTKINKPIMIVK